MGCAPLAPRLGPTPSHAFGTRTHSSLGHGAYQGRRAITYGIVMASDKEALLAVHSRALTAHDVDTIVGHAHQAVRCMCDGQWMGEGPDVLRKAIEAEYVGRDPLVGRIMDLDGEPVLVAFEASETGHKPHGVMRFHSSAQRITECRIEHQPDLVDRLARSATPMR